MTIASRAPEVQRRAIERHYDSFALLYRLLWGQHIHHGLWSDGDESPRQAQERLIARLAERARVGPGDRVLDVGCGYGGSGRWLAARGCRVAGVTISRRQLLIARRYNARSGLDKRTGLLQADAAALPVAAASFDIVWVIECSEHLRDKQRFIADAARTLGPGGRLALCAWVRGSGIAPGDRRVRAVCRAFLCPSLASLAEYRDWCARAGLRLRVTEDLTARVRRTWDVVMGRTSRPWLAWLKPLIRDPEARRFIDGFPAIAEAYASGAMAYGLLVAERGGQGKPWIRPL